MSSHKLLVTSLAFLGTVVLLVALLASPGIYSSIMFMKGIDPSVVEAVTHGQSVVVYYAVYLNKHPSFNTSLCRWRMGNLCIVKQIVRSLGELEKIERVADALVGYPVNTVPKARIALYRVDKIISIRAENLSKFILEFEPALINAHAVSGTPYTGKGITIAIIDTGVDYLHPCLRNSIKALVSVMFAKPIVWYPGINGSLEQAWKVDLEIYNQSGIFAWFDTVGHGTHVAGIIAAHNCPIRGIAPGAKLVIIKAFAGPETSIDYILNAIQWLYYHAKQLNVSILSCSWGMTIPATGVDPVSLALKQLVKDDHIVVFAAAGNDGVAPMDIEAPAGAPWVVAVGAWDYWSHSLAPFSSTGPTPDMRVKPDFVCSGVDILSTYPGGYAIMSGTSMATPACAALYALWYQYLEHELGKKPTISQVLKAMASHTLDRQTPYKNNLVGWGLPIAPP